MGSLTSEAEQYIKDHSDKSNRVLEDDILEKFGLEVSYETIRKFRKSLLTTPKVVKEVVKNFKPKSKIFLTDLSVDFLKNLLDECPDHHYHDYLEKEFIGINGKAGKLRSDLDKLCEFLRDVMA